MEQQKFDSLISRLEIEAKNNPRAYMIQVLWVTALGFLVLGIAVLFALFPLIALAGLGFLVVITKGKALIFVFKLGKLLILLLIPSWVMLKSSFQMLFTRFPKPEGRELFKEDAPQLFKRIEEIRQRTNGPSIHHVLITPELNAGIVQHPRFGLLGWEDNYLILGLPLLQILNADEATAVIAHEYGHLSGHHSRLGGFIYRFRSTWGRLQEISEQWQDWGSRLITKLFGRYAPYFNAYTFVYARNNEYVADSVSVGLVGVKETANALMRTEIAAQFQREVFWPSINKLASSQSEPVSNLSAYWQKVISEQLDENKRIAYLETASRAKTNHYDTHPSLLDRLSAIGAKAETENAKELVLVAESAAKVWLSDTYETIASEFDGEWKKSISDKWVERYNSVTQKRQALADLLAKDNLSVDESWQSLLLDEEVNEVNIEEKILTFSSNHPEHLHARFRTGSIKLSKNDEQGIDDFEFILSKDIQATPIVCETVMDFYHEKNPEKMEEYRQRWISYNQYANAVHDELASLPANADLVTHDLDEDALENLRLLLANNLQYVNKVYLLRRRLKSDQNLYDYVLALELSRFTLGDKSSQVLKRISSIEYPYSIFIVNLNKSPYKKFLKKIEALGVTPLF